MLSLSMPKGVHLPRVSVVCARCGIVFERVGSDTDRRHCSWECARPRAVSPTARQCEGCGTEFIPKKKKQRYCSRGCVTQTAARTVRRTMGDQFPSRQLAKAELLKRDPRCSRCGYDVVPGILQIHHLDRNRFHNHLANVVLLCPNCHEVDHLAALDGRYTILKNNGNH